MSYSQKRLISLGLGVAVSASSLMTAPSALAQTPSIPENCQMLEEITTGMTEIRKKIRRRLVQGDNFNTDFAVPSGVAFKNYKAMMTVENDADYDLAVNLKYADNSVASALAKNKVPMVRGENYDLDFTAPTAGQPYQINLVVSGPNNNVYTIAIMACE
ncbi:MAG: hypothetical protein AB4058_00450 [Microcystaceae cyanobacterium]